MGRMLVVAALILLAACAHKGRDTVKPVFTRLAIGHDITFDPPPGWWLVRLTDDPVLRLTPDGIDVDALEFRAGIAPGMPIFSAFVSPSSSLSDPRLTSGAGSVSKVSHKAASGLFRIDMGADDVMEAVSADLAQRGFSMVRVSGLHPAPFGRAPGFGFDFSYVDQRGLTMTGMALGAVRSGKLDLLLFRAPTEYLFGRHRPAVERAFASIVTP